MYENSSVNKSDPKPEFKSFPKKSEQSKQKLCVPCCYVTSQPCSNFFLYRTAVHTQKILSAAFCAFKVDTRRKFTTSANYRQIIYGWKDFPLKYSNNVLRSHINLLESHKM